MKRCPFCRCSTGIWEVLPPHMGARHLFEVLPKKRVLGVEHGVLYHQFVGLHHHVVGTLLLPLFMKCHSLPHFFFSQFGCRIFSREKPIKNPIPFALPLGIGMEEEQVALKSYGQFFKVCKNRPENDAHWDSEVVQGDGFRMLRARGLMEWEVTMRCYYEQTHSLRRSKLLNLRWLQACRMLWAYLSPQLCITIGISSW